VRGIIIKEKYQIKDFIRGGGFGDVFLAKHSDKGYDVAVKFVSIRIYFHWRVTDKLNKSFNANFRETLTIKRL
jgi:serine/threonine protein kinase